MNTTLSLRISPDLKEEASRTFRNVGLDLSSAITIFLKKSIRAHGIPFPVTDTAESPVPNAATRAALEESIRLENDPAAKRYDDIDEMFQDILA